MEHPVEAGNTLEPGRKAENTIIGQDNIKNGPFESNGDVNATERPWAKKIIDDLDIEGINNGQEPYVIVVGVGSNYDKGSQASLLAQTTEHDKYTVFYMFYMETPESTPLFYFNGEWSEHHPRANDSSDLMDTNNVIQIGPLAGKRLQYYCLSNKTGKGTIQDKQFWNWIRGL